MAHPFEDDRARYRVIVNDEGQHSLWPAAADVPQGWSARHGPDTRQACLDHVEENWTDMRPRSLPRDIHPFAIHPVSRARRDNDRGGGHQYPHDHKKG